MSSPSVLLDTAFGMFGESYRSNETVDFRKSIKNYTSQLLDGYKTECYFSTQDHALEEDLVAVWKPRQYMLVQKSIENRSHLRNMHLINTCRLILEAQKLRGKVYDWVILTRFDLLFTQRLFDLSVSQSHINLAFRGERDPLIDDNIYIMHGSLLQAFYNVIDSAWDKSSRLIRGDLEAELGKIHFIIDENCDAVKNPLYTRTSTPITLH
jgi:hypothetical protein